MDIRKIARKRRKKVLTIVLIFMLFVALCGIPIFAANPFMGVFIEIVALPTIGLTIWGMGSKAPAEKKMDAFLARFGNPEEIYAYVSKMQDFPLKNKAQILRFDKNWLCTIDNMAGFFIFPMSMVEQVSVSKPQGSNRDGDFFAKIHIRNPYGKPMEPGTAFMDTLALDQLDIHVGKGQEEATRILEALKAIGE